MRYITWLTAAFIILSGTVYSQPIFEENFDYSTGAFSTVQSNWSGSGATEANVVEGSLSYTLYPSSGIGNKLNILTTSSQDYQYSFSTSISSGSVYLSFLLNVPDLTGLQGNSATGDYFIHFKSGSSGIALLDIRKGSDDTFYQLGIQKKTGSTTLYLQTKQLSYNTTALIVLAYTFNSNSTTDDEIKLWINPSLAGGEPTADLVFSDSQTDPTDLDNVNIRQGTYTPNAYIDGIRVATSWSEAPLPVELKSFSASQSGNSVELNWRTATEVNNYGFEVQKSEAGGQESELMQSSNFNNAGWQKIGFVDGHGNSNSAKQYAFVDKKPFNGKNYYRLKQIDNDGNFKYSNEIFIDYNNRFDFYLYQNYPNPFNSSSVIKYTLDKKENVSFILYNQLGEIVFEFPQGIKEPGTHQFNLNFEKTDKHLASGIYLLRLASGSKSKAIKINYLK